MNNFDSGRDASCSARARLCDSERQMLQGAHQGLVDAVEVIHCEVFYGHGVSDRSTGNIISRP